YTIIEISMFEGRSVASKKTLFRLLFERLHEQLHISPQDVEITITETPRHNWGIRGLPGDELQLNYKVDID
ncbi:MAG: tautomerase family protein, partial [Anaerolineae bacterium]|nr:tautomerase family protein [Anaerolineae bacterium]